LSKSEKEQEYFGEFTMDAKITKIYQAVINGDQDEVKKFVQEMVDEKTNPEVILKDGLIAAMAEVGDRFENGDFFVPEMLIAARAMQAGLAILKPLLVEQGVKAIGKIVIGTVKGDLHDIGKNLVAMMLEGAGFEIVDLGTDVSPDKFVQAVRQHEPVMVGMSALLTTTMVNMQATVSALKEAGLRDKVKIIVGGAPVTSGYTEQIGADGYGADASRAVSLAKSLLVE
jgi:5-methyltetrahydrofolate--homocysteine methyltransferase